MRNPAIIIATYNRPNSLKRLLGSICNANYDFYSNIPLVISIDGGDTDEMFEIANRFEWKYGEKQIIAHKENLGLRKHIISCGDLSEEYDSIILLEDDLFVSPYFYDYVVKALDFYREEQNIAGISLFSYRHNEYVGLPFVPSQNGYDVFFMQVPSSWGQAWTRKQWQSFKQFYETNPVITNMDKLPDSVKGWPCTSWKKYFYKYIVENDLYFVYPYNAYTTNFGDAGTHYEAKTTVLQTKLMNVHKNNSFSRLAESKIIYDAYMDLQPQCFWQMGIKEGVDFCVDTYGLKQLELFENAYCFSIKESVCPIEQYAMDFVPIENNILFNFTGEKFSFSKRTDFKASVAPDIYNEIRQIYNGVTYNRAYGKGYDDGFKEGRASVKQTKSYKLGYYLSHPLKWRKNI
jgi:glycosyltransferase involved in cell wall biosynthesis